MELYRGGERERERDQNKKEEENEIKVERAECIYSARRE